MQLQKYGSGSMNPTLRAALDVVTKGGLLKLFRAAYRAAPLMLYLPSHLRMMRILKTPPVSELTARRPKLGYKYLYRPYLVHSFTKKMRLDALDFHYRFLAERVNGDFFARIYDGEYKLWQDVREDVTAEITLSFPVDWEHDYEGDLLLKFKCDGECIYSITFSIVPGCALGRDEEQLIIVTAIQGGAGMAHHIRKIKENYGDLAPPMLLLAGIEGIALALNIRLLAGVGLDQQVQKQTWGNEKFTFDYDRFWNEAIGERSDGIYYVRPVPELLKPLEEVKAKHRKKTQFRRSVKASIREGSQISFEKQCLVDKSVLRRVAIEDHAKPTEE